MNNLSVFEQKKLLRSQMRQHCRTSDPARLAQLSSEIALSIEQSVRFRQAATVGLYWALPDEPSLRSLIEKWGSRKEIVLPVVDGDEMFFRRYTPQCRMDSGSFGIDHPAEGDSVSAHRMDLIVVPGVAFDRAGYRLGRGKGYYDRFLDGHEVYKIGVCFPFQLVESVPHERHDIAMDEVFTG